MKDKFLNRLRALLRDMPEKDRDEMIADLEEHFMIGLENGKTEAEIIQELGDPEAIASEALADYNPKKRAERQPAAGVVRMVLAAAGLVLINLIFIVGPAAGIFAAYLSLLAAAAGFVLSPILSFGFLIFSSTQQFLLAFFLSLILCGLGLVLGIAMIYVGKFLCAAVVKYVRFNVRVIRGRKSS